MITTENKCHIWETAAGILLGLLLFLGFMLWLVCNNECHLRKEAVQLGHAEYNSTNGHWQWKENK